MKPDTLLRRLNSISVKSGFNIFKTIDVSSYDNITEGKNSVRELLPEAKTITLIGFGGNYFWGKFREFLDQNPRFKEEHEDLIDNYSLLVFEQFSRALKGVNIEHRAVFPFGADASLIDFVKLGEAAGVGVKSLLGILIHPEYGPWISLRGALVTGIQPQHYDRPLDSFNPCPTCHKPCIDACPAKTISLAGWDWESCMRYRISEDSCSSNCASRRACPYGQEQQYPYEQESYHHKFVLRSVRKYFRES